MFDYIRDPQEIYRRSFAEVRAACDLSRLPEGMDEIVLRLVHACGMPEIVPDLAWEGDVMAAGRAALSAGAPVITDCRMAADGVTLARMPAGTRVLCPLNDPAVPEMARRLGTTRSAAAVELWLPNLAGAVVAIGNAPTALFRLLEVLAQGAPRPAVIFGFPVGFVGAAESKQALIEAELDLPYVTLTGRRGGSALAAAAVNALGQEAQ